LPQSAIFGPVFATLCLTFAVWVFMYVKRIRFITRNALGQDEMSVPGRLAELSPPDVSNPSDNLKNLFEIPVLFYALALYLFVTGQVDATYVAAGWIFVAFRVVHSIVHCTFNLVMLRFSMYAISTCAFWFMVARAALDYVAVGAAQSMT
jgi:hypothetical protein